MSSSHNLDERLVLEYITQTFKNWGINYMSEDILKLAKKNDLVCLQEIRRLLFDLVILHILDYDYFVDQLNIRFEEEDEEMLEIVLAHLYEIDCQMVVVFATQKGCETAIGFDFNSPRHMLIACGWVMAVGDIFNQTIPKLISKKMTNIYKPKTLNLAALSQKYTISLGRINLHEESPQIDRIAYLSKVLKNRKYSIDCLMAKRKKLMNKLKNQLQKVGNDLTIEDVFSSSNSQEVQIMQNQLRGILKFQKENMKYRKYWWAWLDSKIINVQEKDLINQFEDTYQKLQCVKDSHRFRIKIDLDFPIKYIQIFQECQEKMSELIERIEEIGFSKKKNYKEITRQIDDEMKSLAERGKDSQESFPSFVGLQLKRYIKLGVSSAENNPKEYKDQIKKSNKKLRQSIRTFISDLEGILIF